MEKLDKLNIETFGKIIDQFLTENEVNMLITLPKGSLDAQIQENIKLGSVCGMGRNCRYISCYDQERNNWW